MFAPVTKEERKALNDEQMFAPPSEDELKELGVTPGKPSWDDSDKSFTDRLIDDLNPMNYPENLAKVMEFVDHYTGAPVRKFVSETAKQKKLDKAPTGREQAKDLGVSDKDLNELTDGAFREEEGSFPTILGKITPAMAAGVGLEAAQDPLTYALPFAESGLKALGAGARRAKDLIAAGIKSRAYESGPIADVAANVMMDVANPGMSNIMEKSKKGAGVFSSWPKPLEDMTIPDQFKRMREIEYVVPDLANPPQPIHYEMLKSGKNMRDIKNKMSQLSPSEINAFNNYNMGMLKESEGKIAEIPNAISGKPPRSMSDEGADVIGVTRDVYRGEREKLAPLFDELQTRAEPLSPDETKDLAIAIMDNTRTSPGLFGVNKEGRVSLNPNQPRFGISDQEYGVLKKVIDDLNDGATFEDIQRMREYMRKAVDPSNPKAYARINEARKIMLDYLEGMTSQMDFGMDKTGKMQNKVHKLFQDFAKNERNKDAIEDIIGGSIESSDALFAANPDKVVSKILSNPNHTKAFKSYIGPDKMDEVVAAYVNDGIQQATHSTQGFRPHIFQNWLKKNANVLENNLPSETIDRLNALADNAWISKRFMDSANPSGTADALGAIFKNKGFINNALGGNVTGAIKGLGEGILERRRASQLRNEFTQMNQMPKPSPLMPESTIDRAKRLNLERKAQKGKLQ